MLSFRSVSTTGNISGNEIWQNFIENCQSGNDRCIWNCLVQLCMVPTFQETLPGEQWSESQAPPETHPEQKLSTT